MSGRVIKSGSTDQYCEVKVWTTADGVPNTTLAYNTSGLAIWYQIGNAAPIEVVVGGSPAPATMSAGGAHADWGIYHVAQGRYKIGLADAVVASAANVTVWIVFTDCDSAPCEIDVVGYDKTAVAVGANTVAPATLADVQGELPTNFGDLLINASGHIERVVLVDTTTTNTDMRGTEDASTHSAADVLTAFGTGTWATAITWNAAWDAEVQSEVNDALVALDLDSALIDQGAERAVNVDVNHRVHSHVYDMQANTITASALAADAVAEIQSGLATSAALQVVDGNVDLIAAYTSALLARVTSTVATLWANLTAMITGSGATAKFTTTALENGPAGGGGGGSVNVLPATGIVAERAAGVTLTPIVGETISQSITLYQPDGTTAVYMSGKTLAIVFETMSGIDVAVVASGNITISGDSSNVLTFAYPSAVTATERVLRFAIRDASAPLTMYLQGVCSVGSAPRVDT